MALLAAQALCRTITVRRLLAPIRWLTAGLLFTLLAAAAELETTREFEVKAVFLFNFAQFVEWPPEAFKDPESPLTIGILGHDPFGHFLDDTVDGETVNGRPIVVQRYRKLEDVDQCHILFISGSEGADADRIFSKLKGCSTLTVCDWETTNKNGAVVLFIMDRGRVRLRINLEAAKEAGLNISSKLLRSAELVPQGEPRR